MSSHLLELAPMVGRILQPGLARAHAKHPTLLILLLASDVQQPLDPLELTLVNALR
jgi:hypothetical protein